MKKFALAHVIIFAAAPAFSNPGVWEENALLAPYIAMRTSYIFLEPKGNQTVYNAPGGVPGAKISEEELSIDDSRAFGIKLAVGGETALPLVPGRIRVEAEYSNNGSFTTPISSSGGDAVFETQSSALLANAYYSFDLGGAVSPYVGAGAGFSHFTASGDFSSGAFNGKLSKSEYRLGWQAGAGVGVYLARGASLEIGYRYSDLGKFNGGVDIRQLTAAGSTISNAVVLHNDVDIEFRAHEIMLGIRYMM